MLEICRQNNSIVLNGRSIGDLQGKSTMASFQYNGYAVVDYCTISHGFMDKIMYFSVFDPTHLSDHAPISVCVHALFKLLNEHTSSPKTKFPRGFKWNEESYNEAIKLKQFGKRYS